MTRVAVYRECIENDDANSLTDDKQSRHKQQTITIIEIYIIVL